MGTRFSGRPKDLNMEQVTTVRLLPNQRKKLEKYAALYQISVSDLIREAVTVWLNSNSEGKEG